MNRGPPTGDRVGHPTLVAALVGLALVMAVVEDAVVMAAAAGARRTDGSLDRFLAESATHDARIESFVMGELSEVEAIEATVATDPGVVDSASGYLYVSDTADGARFRLARRPRRRHVPGHRPPADGGGPTPGSRTRPTRSP